MQLVAHLADAPGLLRVDFRPDLVVGFGHRAAETDIPVRDLQADIVRVEPPVMAQGLMQVLADVVIGASGARGSAAAVGAPAVVGGASVGVEAPRINLAAVECLHAGLQGSYG